jgi:hypothetical protein
MIENELTGDPIKDGIIIGIIFVIFKDFYTIVFSSVFGLFKN